MPIEVILPKVDMDMTHGTLATWHVAEGDLVKQGDALFDIETDKAAMEVEAPATGRLHNISARPGDKVAVGTTIAWLYSADESIALPSAEPPNQAAAEADQIDDILIGPAPVEVILPKVDMDMAHGTLATWHVAEGETVKQGAPLFDIETDKAAMEVEAPASGQLHHIVAKPGDKVAVGSVIAWIYPEGATLGARPKTNNVGSETTLAVPETAKELSGTSHGKSNPLLPDHGQHAVIKTAVNDTSGREPGVRATPAARAAMQSAGIAEPEISGTGPLGRIQKDDVADYLQSRRKAPQAEPTLPFWSAEPGHLHGTRRKGYGIPVVLIHGFTADSQSWAPLERVLDKNIPLIRIDLPGHGKSPKKKIDGFAQLARLMVDAFDAATRDFDQVHVLAHSLGGAIALSIADVRGRKIASLNIISPAGLGPEINGNALNGIVRASKAESLAPWLRQLTAKPGSISDEYARAAMKLRMDQSLRAYQADMASSLFPDGVQAFDIRPALNRLAMPIQILWGKQDHILPKSHAFSGKVDLGVFLLDEAGHIPQFECPERVAKIVSRLISAASPVSQGDRTRED
jgi:pyruvate/2-oxoglutarate dehydrogenase complex dihydrolipoamide acyltransferase (E2) component